MIKAEHRNGKDRRIESYPALGVKDGMIVLFSSEDTGTVLTAKEDSIWEVGHYAEDWITDVFFLLDGEVTLSNS